MSGHLRIAGGQEFKNSAAVRSFLSQSFQNGDRVIVSRHDKDGGLANLEPATSGNLNFNQCGTYLDLPNELAEISLTSSGKTTLVNNSCKDDETGTPSIKYTSN